MPVPSTLGQLSVTAGSNSPAGSDSPTVIDDHMRAAYSFLAYLRDSKQLTTEATVASAATTDIGAASSYAVNITGTTTITSLGTDYQGPRFLRFSGALTLTHNASTLILPGAADITTAAGDTCIAIAQSGGGWRIYGYQRAAGLGLAGPAFSAYQSSAQSVAHNTFTKVQLQTKEFDTANAFSTSTHRFQPLVPGYYQINGAVGLINNATDMIAVIYKNGAAAKRGSRYSASSAGTSVVSALVYLNGSTDYVELYCYQASGATATTANSATETYFQAFAAR